MICLTYIIFTQSGIEWLIYIYTYIVLCAVNKLATQSITQIQLVINEMGMQHITIGSVQTGA